MTPRPLGDWILVELHPLPECSGGGIIIPLGASGSDIRFARVLATGPGRELPSGVREPCDVAAGDIVAFDRWHTQHQSGAATTHVLSDEGAERSLVKPADILFAVEDPPDDLYEVIWGSHASGDA